MPALYEMTAKNDASAMETPFFSFGFSIHK